MKSSETLSDAVKCYHNQSNSPSEKTRLCLYSTCTPAPHSFTMSFIITFHCFFIPNLSYLPPSPNFSLRNFLSQWLTTLVMLLNLSDPKYIYLFFSRPTLAQWNQNLWGWGPIATFKRFPACPDTHPRLKTSQAMQRLPGRPHCVRCSSSNGFQYWPRATLCRGIELCPALLTLLHGFLSL